ncbi:MAG: type II toxin-antitoxin system RatA family toxin [Rubrivivax sp.]|nr:type II toxin-antitoxin system RatA family toxin [Rubrivivax sp.]
MKHVRKSVLLMYSPVEMYDLVAAIEAYPQFLPWCNSAQVLAQHDDGVTARLGLAYMGVRHAFTTRNVQVPGERVAMELVDGPFSRLDGAWLFRPLGPAGRAGQACKIEFDLRYTFASKALEKLVSPVFDKVANTFVERFVSRAEEVYGQR